MNIKNISIKFLIISICMLGISDSSYAFGFRKKPVTTKKVIKGAIEENTVLSIDNCIKLALANNPAILAAKSNADVIKTKIGQARSQYAPEISLSSGMTRSNSLVNSSSPFVFDKDISSYTLGVAKVDQLIYDFGKTSTNVDIQKLNYESSSSELKRVIQEVIFSVKQAYYNLLFVIEQQEVIDESAAQYEDLLEQANAFYKIGTKAKIDVTIAQTNLSNAKLSLIKANNDVKFAKVKLNKAMGLINAPDYTLKERLEFKNHDIDEKEIVDIAYKNRPEIKSAESQLNLAKKQISLSKKVVIPQLKANGEYAIGGSDFTNDHGWVAGLKLEVPTFNPFKTKKFVDEAKAIKERETARLEQVKQEVYLEVQQAYIKYLEAMQSVPVSEQSVAQAEENYNLAKGRYKVGLSTPIEFKEAELMHRNAKLEYLKILYNYNVSISNLEKVISEEL